MKKITTIATALLLGSFGFTALADATDIVPNVTPVSGSLLNTWPDTYSPIQVSWEENEISLNTESEAYDKMIGDALNIEVYINGELYETTNPRLGTTVTNYAIGVVNQAENGLEVFVTWDDESFKSEYPNPVSIEFVIPEGAVNIGSDGDTNEQISLNYYLVLQQSSDEPIVTPASGIVFGSFPQNIAIAWPGKAITLSGNEGKLNLPVTADGEAWSENATAYLGYYNGYGWAESEEDNPVTALVVSLPYVYEINEISLTLPANSVNVDGTPYDQSIDMNYTLFSVDEYCSPAKGSEQFSISEFELGMNWLTNGDVDDSVEVKLSLNENRGEALYGIGDGYWEWEPKGTVNSEVTESGTVKVSLQSAYTTPGNMAFKFPANYFNVTVNDQTAPYPDELVVNYSISPVRHTPENGWSGVVGPFNSFTLYAQETLALAQDAEISITDEFENTLTYTAKSTSYENYSAIEVTLESPFYGDNLYINIPSGALTLGGEAYEYDTSWDYIVVSPTISPANGSNVAQLDNISINWGERTLSLNEIDATPTLTIGNATPIALTKDQYKVEDITVEGPDYGFGPSETTTYYFVIDFGETPYTEVGSYTITIPAGLISIDFEDTNNEMVLNYKVDVMTEVPTLVYEADPVMPRVVVYWDEDVDTLTDSNSVAGSLTVPAKGENGTNVVVPVNLSLTVYSDEEAEAQPSAATDFASGNNALMLLMSEYISEYGVGEYTLSFASVVRNSEGLLNLPFEKSFTVEALAQPTAIEPSLSYEDVNTLVISWNGEAVSVLEPNAEVILLTDSNDEFEKRLAIGKGVTVNKDNITVNLEGLDLETGVKYQVMIGEAQFYIGEGNSYYNDAVDFEFIYGSTGINAIESVNGAVEGVYNLQGVKVGNSLDNLNPGIYVINGKKVLIRK